MSAALSYPVANVERLAAQAICRRVETLFTARGGFAMQPSPVQLAICRVIDGTPLRELALRDDVRHVFGGTVPTETPPKEIDMLAGIRCGKSLIAGATGLKWSQTVDVSALGPGEVPRVSIVSTAMENAAVIFDHVSGRMLASPFLRTLLLEEPRAGVVLVRHPTGRPVEIKVVAGSRAGQSLTSRWMAGVIFDEYPRMSGADDAVINWDDQRKAVAHRILPGGGILSLGSPWAPFGPAYARHTEHFGRPTRAVVVIQAPAYMMNPAWWTPERCADAKAADPDSWITDGEAQFSTPEESLFGGTELDRATRVTPTELEPIRENEYAAAMDPATRSNAWTLVVATREGGKKRIAVARQWIGSKADPLSSGEVLASIGEVCAQYGIKYVETDQYYVDALEEIARSPTYTAKDGTIVTKKPVLLRQVNMTEHEKVQVWLALKARMGEGDIELSPDPVFRADMQRVKKRPTQSGVSVVLPRTSDGRHCDYAPPTMLVLRRWIREPSAPPPRTPEEADRQALAREQARMLEIAKKRFGRKR